MKAAPAPQTQSPALATPVVLLIFNRPGTTARVLAEVRRVRPTRLYVIADGPRPDHPQDGLRCAETRRIVEAGVDWPCQVETDFAATNLGCGRRLASGIDWVFSQTEEAIFLEDDCLPAPEFFPFCSELLAKYRDNPRVGQICGCTFVAPRVVRADSYLFSLYGPVWGWASWRRAWRCYDYRMGQWEEFCASEAWRERIPSKTERTLRRRVYAEISTGRLDTWDYQWGFAKLRHGLWSVIPCVNLIENIGFGDGGTHTTSRMLGLPRGTLEFPLRHPALARDEEFDRAFSRQIAPGWTRRLWRRLKGRLAR